MSGGGWASCLDSFADHLAAQAEALAAGHPELIAAFVPPPGLGPLPAGLLVRARALQSQAESLTEAVSQTRRRTRAALVHLARPSQATRPTFVDSRA